MSIRRSCLDCGALTEASRCRACQRQRRRDTYDHPAYRALGRPSGRCRLRIRCNGAPATTWDHFDGNPRNHHRSNLVPACGSCNSSKGDRPL